MTYSRPENPLETIFDSLFQSFGPQNWWPADTVDETVTGAVLTQNVAWSNVEKALANLKQEKILTLEQIRQTPQPRLADLILPARFSRQKAVYLHNVADFFRQWDYHYEAVKKNHSLPGLRKELLKVKGVGEETADTILLYGLEFPSFVIDAYTKRLSYRYGIVENFEIKYRDLQIFFEENLQTDVNLYNEYHALIVQLAKRFCTKRNPGCSDCPLNSKCLRRIE
jgi:endonuclease-3 related protein